MPTLAVLPSGSFRSRYAAVDRSQSPLGAGLYSRPCVRRRKRVRSLRPGRGRRSEKRLRSPRGSRRACRLQPPRRLACRNYEPRRRNHDRNKTGDHAEAGKPSFTISGWSLHPERCVRRLHEARAPAAMDGTSLTMVSCASGLDGARRSTEKRILPVADTCSAMTGSLPTRISWTGRRRPF